MGTITKTADVGTCPGKCIHALASLLCEKVREDVQCPDSSMRCCVERPRKKKKPTKSQNPLGNNVNDKETTTKATTVKKVKKTKRKQTTTVRTTTQKQVRNMLNAYAHAILIIGICGCLSQLSLSLDFSRAIFALIL